jgi:ABC-type multidrug transport system fused ATPase/permease subunit
VPILFYSTLYVRKVPLFSSLVVVFFSFFFRFIILILSPSSITSNNTLLLFFLSFSVVTRSHWFIIFLFSLFLCFSCSRSPSFFFYLVLVSSITAENLWTKCEKARSSLSSRRRETCAGLRVISTGLTILRHASVFQSDLTDLRKKENYIAVFLGCCFAFQLCSTSSIRS